MVSVSAGGDMGSENLIKHFEKMKKVRYAEVTSKKSWMCTIAQMEVCRAGI